MERSERKSETQTGPDKPSSSVENAHGVPLAGLDDATQRSLVSPHDGWNAAQATDRIESPTLAPTTSSETNLSEGVSAPGRWFGDYLLLEEIARGGMGIVFRAQQRGLNRTVALKMILSGQFAGEQDVQRFQAEAEAAARLDHSGIVPIYEIGEWEGQHYFSMGFVEGSSLAEAVQEGPIEVRQAASWTLKISTAMAYAHEQGVVHRDLKPANILLDRSGEPKVTDFGLAKRSESDCQLTGTGQVLGTPAYMPPEQAAGKAEEIGPVSDVYSIGAILYCLLTGRPPHQSATPMDTLLQVLEQDPVPPRRLNPNIPLDLESVCLKALQKNPTKRYQSSQELADDLQRFLSGEATQARPVGSFEYAWNWYWHNLQKVAGALTLASCAFFAINRLVTMSIDLTALLQTNAWQAWFLVSPFLFAMAVVLVGSKCGVLTIRGHRISLLGSVGALVTIAWPHLQASWYIYQSSRQLALASDSASRSVNALLASYSHTLSLWFLICITTQILAVIYGDNRGQVFGWRNDWRSLLRNRRRVTRNLALVLLGIILMWLGGNPWTPAGIMTLAGVCLIVSGLLAAMRIR